MKKTMLALLVLAAATGVATAGVGINWGTAWAVHDNGAVPPHPLDGSSNLLLDTYSAIWQLIYAGPNDVIEPLVSHDLNTGDPGIQDDYIPTGSDDVVWAQRIIPVGGNSGGVPCDDGTEWDNWMMLTSASTPFEMTTFVPATGTEDFVYQRIFEGIPGVGTWYYQSELFEINEGYVVGGGSAAQDFVLGDPQGTGIYANTQIPEPATMGLLGLGALVMAIRRRRS